ncbi:uncharacterized protein C2orf42 homolog isoform X2 [Anguilla anguilla]|uniref:uncharacterized protein C2orf42 homolog isoform X2 n=1 Tax=Anguilla anguilla TaxID=7936 RepID=UPI0015B2CF87|nr:uncharacterized protein C2orf42 homolog isoform X2 [Anguilla anguilla]
MTKPSRLLASQVFKEKLINCYPGISRSAKEISQNSEVKLPLHQSRKTSITRMPHQNEASLLGPRDHPTIQPNAALQLQCRAVFVRRNGDGRGEEDACCSGLKPTIQRGDPIIGAKTQISQHATTMEAASIEAGVAVSQPAVVSSPPAVPAPPGLGGRARDRRKTPAFLWNLGKPTLRGIRKCPQCGVYNGTRGLSCKNKACGAVFRDGGPAGGGRGPKKAGAEVVRLVTDGGGGEAGGAGGGAGGGTQVFSVRQRGRGPEQRGFVELALTDTAIATADGTVLTRVSLGRCFLSACRQGRGGGPAQAQPRPQQRPESPCAHVKQAMDCHAQATPLPLKSSVLDALRGSAQAREDLWRLAAESPGPLVQRVSRGTLVVKCHVTESHPLGLLHLSVGGRGAGRSREGRGAYFHCACQAGGQARRGPGAGAGARGAGEFPGEARDPDAAAPLPPSPPEACLHFFACVCAFASDDKLAAEFSAFLNYDTNGVQVSLDCSMLCSSPQQQSDPGSHHRSKKLRMEDPSLVTAPTLAVREGSSAPALRKGGQRKHPISTAPKNSDVQPVHESHVSLPFRQWLASVTERIHQTMHFQFDGKPEPLVFHIPQSFFNALQQRLSLGSKKRRLPNSTTAFVRNDALPLGTFSKYTWHITNLLQVKRIFDTQELPLELTQSFVKNRDGSFSPFRCQEAPPESLAEGYGRADRPQAIRPLELRTFLKVGPSSSEQKEATPFVIEWIPDILPRSRVGELRIRFEYGHQHGHQHGGQPEACEGGAPVAEGNHPAPAPAPTPAPSLEIIRVAVP